MAVNGTPPTQDAQRLIRRTYADRAVANLGNQRLITDHFLREFGAFNPMRVGIADLRRMRLDAMIKMGLYYAKAPIVRADWEIHCEDPVIKAAVREIVGRVRQSWLKTALLKLDYGFQGAVKDYELGRLETTYEDPETGDILPVWDDDVVKPVVIGKPIPIPPEYARVHLEDGHFAGIETTIGGGTAEDGVIPAEWALWFTNEFEEEHRNYYGVSRILPAYEAWYSYWFTFHMRSRHVEMDADPALQIWYPTGDYTDANGEKRSNRDAALEAGAALRGGATIAWPSDVHVDEQGKATPIALWRAEFLTGGENLEAFNRVLSDLEIQKLRATLVPEEALVSTVGGLNSGMKAKSYGQIFTESLEMEAADLDAYFTDYQIRPIVEANWGKDAPECKIVTTGFQQEDLSLASELIKIAFNLDPNALPIRFEELLERLNLPQYTAAEQTEREEAAAEAAQQAQRAQAAAAGGVPEGPSGASVGTLPGESGPDPQELSASQDRARRTPRKYERERIDLGGTVQSTAPDWARRENERRQHNVDAIAERLRGLSQQMYGDLFDTAADALEDEDTIELGITDAVSSLMGRIGRAVRDRIGNWRDRLQGEHASMYHAAGLAELHRLGLSGESWDVGRDEVQEWAREHAGELVKTIERTVVEQTVRPWLTKALSEAGYGAAPDGIPVSTYELSAQLRDKFANYPQWMAERLVRTESMRGYNLSAADMWERVGVIEVEEYDGLGGKTGQTDEHCLARNGRVVTLEEFREDTLKEHPNGTLGAVPVTVDVELRPLYGGPVEIYASQSESIYAVTGDGLILSEEATGRLLAGEE